MGALRVQVMVVPISGAAYDYAAEVRSILRKAGLHVDADVSGNKMQKKVRQGHACVGRQAGRHRLLAPAHPLRGVQGALKQHGPTTYLQAAAAVIACTLSVLYPWVKVACCALGVACMAVAGSTASPTQCADCKRHS